MALNNEKVWKNPLDPENLSLDEKEKMIQFKHEFAEEALLPNKSYLTDEHYLIHWLKARKFDVQKAKAMLHNHLRLRNAVGMDDPAYMDYKVNPVSSKYYPRGQFGVAKNGMPCVYFALGGVDPKGILHSVRTSDIFCAIIYWQEERKISNKQYSQQSGKPVQQVYYILDLKGLGASHLYGPGLEVFQQIAKLVEQHTPEITYKIFILNAPTVFSFIYRLIRPILDQNTQNKLNIFGSDGWKSAMLSEIDADQLPEHYGGTCTGEDGDPKCLHKITYGGLVPHELYFDKDKKETIIPADVKTLHVARGCTTFIKFSTISKKTLKWYFEIPSGCDIGFGIYKCNDDVTDNEEFIVEQSGDSKSLDTLDMVQPYFRLITNLVPESGSLHVHNQTYCIVFDNSYSWLHGKSIHYSFALSAQI